MMLDPNTQAIVDTVSGLVAERFARDNAIADLGCGDGVLLGALADKGFTQLTGVGYTIGEMGKAQAVSGVDLCREQWSAQLQNRTFDVVISTEVIEHLTNPFLFLSEAHKLLKEGGTLILTFPNVHNIRSIIGYALTGRLSGFFGPNFNNNHPLYDQHIFIPNMHLIRYLLKVAGYTVTEERYVNGKGKLFSQTALVVARRNGNA